ncbi:hypothetical protein D3C78_980920 [compost metagenome]
MAPLAVIAHQHPQPHPVAGPIDPLVFQLVRQLAPLHLGAVCHVRQPGPHCIFQCQHKGGLGHLGAALVIVAEIPLHVFCDQRQLVLGQIAGRLQIGLYLGDHPVEAFPLKLFGLLPLLLELGDEGFIPLSTFVHGHYSSAEP